MRKKHLVYLSLLVTFVYVILNEILYLFNVSYITIYNYFKFFDLIFLRYLTFYLLTFIFLFVLSLLVNKFSSYFKHIRSYVVISLSLLFLKNIMILIFFNGSKIFSFQGELSSFLVIFFTTTLFFYSIYHANLLK